MRLNTSKLILLCVVTCSANIAFAQQARQEKSDSTSQIPYENKDDVFYKRSDNFTAVKASDIPDAIKTTLKKSRYRGWQEGEFLRSGDGKIYVLRMGDGPDAVVYRFNAEGKLVGHNDRR